MIKLRHSTSKSVKEVLRPKVIKKTSYIKKKFGERSSEALFT